MEFLILIGVTLVCLVLEGFFAGSELALVSADKVRLKQRAAQGKSGARIAMDLLKRPHWLFSTTLLGQNLFIVGNTVFATWFLVSYFGPEQEFWAILLTPLILIFGEAVPKSLFQMNADKWVDRIAPAVLGFSWLTSVVVYPLSRLVQMMIGAGAWDHAAGAAVTRDMLEVLIRDKETGDHLDPAVKQIILKVFDFGAARVSGVMTPLVDVFSLREGATIEEALGWFEEEGYSRAPVFTRRAYNIIGMVSFFDLLLAADKTRPVTEVMQAPLYVPELMRAQDLFQQLKNNRKALAVVVDEHGGAIGIVTLEDLLEEVVGEIEDEFDETPKTWKAVAPGAFLFEGDVKIDVINDTFHWGLSKDGDYETLAGLILYHMGKIPEVGATLRLGELSLTVEAADARKIEKILVKCW